MQILNPQTGENVIISMEDYRKDRETRKLLRAGSLSEETVEALRASEMSPTAEDRRSQCQAAESESEQFIPSCGNVFVDLGLPADTALNLPQSDPSDETN